MEEIEKWEYACNGLGYEFARKYFGGADGYWVADDCGGVFCINDYFFEPHEMADFMRFKYSKKKMFEYYEYSMEEHRNERTPMNIKNYKKAE